MNSINLKSLAIILMITFIFLINKSVSFSQESIENALVVRVNPEYLDLNKIDNSNYSKDFFLEFCNSAGQVMIKDLDKKNNSEIYNIRIEKLFKNLKSTDSISIGRQGQTVKMPPFWATFTFYFNDEKNLFKYKSILDNSYPLIFYTHRFFELEFETTPNDTNYILQKGLRNDLNPIADINFENAWNIESGKKFIKVGVFDSGIDSEHEDLEVLTGCTCYEYNNYLDYEFGVDKLGHGTSVAGIIGAKSNNNIGITGIAGGNQSDTSSIGVSLLDFKLTDSIPTYSRFGVGVGLIDASRRVGTYFDWVNNDDPNLLSELQTPNNPGYGIHIANHSYNLKVYPFTRPNENGIGDTIFIDDMDEPSINECYLCREAFLFSLKNGVTNVVSRGNRTNMLISEIGLPKVPTIYDDSWIISVGSSDINGGFIDSNELTANGYVSYIGRSVDVIAPGTKSTVFTTKSTHFNTGYAYRNFNGTSAAAPHVSGVASLLLSKYNKSCYSNTNLDPADVEYIIQKSATDLGSVNYDDSTGWGLINAEKALQMIEFPKFQIIHPQNNPETINLIEIDTIHLYLNKPLYIEYNGPIGSNFTPEKNKYYKSERYKYELTYDFSNYISNNTKLLDTWVRHSQTNSAILILDTFYTLDYLGFTGQLTSVLHMDTFKIEPYAYISTVDTLNSKITLTGYYYHFIKKMDDIFQNEISTQDYWYPLNPLINRPQMAYSIYIQDSTLISRFDFPCDSSNNLIDPNLGIEKLENFDVNIYPNPSNGEIIIESINGNLDGNLKLFNIEGRTVLHSVLNNDKKYTFNLSNLPSGMYYVEFNSKNINLRKKWVKL